MSRRLYRLAWAGAIALLVIAWAGIAPAAAAIVPFLVPFAFLETGYLFFYTVFARRYAERLERRINRLVGVDALIAHRLKAAYFYPPDARTLAALSLGNPAGLMSVTTVGYTVGAGLLWLAGFSGLLSLADGARGLGVLLVPGAVLWTAGIAGYLFWTFWTRHDEARLVAELDRWGGLGRPPRCALRARSLVSRGETAGNGGAGPRRPLIFG